ncbi:MAG: hypothetical protein NXI10_07045 [bacterium]|nr:hypothetical protein [bacterium]
MEVPINTELQREELTALYKFHYAENEKGARNYLIIGVLATISGFAIVYERDEILNFGHLLLATGCYYVFYPINLFSQIKKIRNNMVETEMNRLERIQKSSPTIIYEFSDKGYYYWDSDFEMNVRWSYFKEYVIEEDRVFIRFVSGALSSFSKDHVGVHNFEKIKEIIQRNVVRAEENPNLEQPKENDILDEGIKN